MRNYYNYFTEIEEHFVRKRGKNLLVSPLDWCLIDLWKSNGVPLHVAIRGIDQSFESAEKRSRRPPTTLHYCHPAVMEAFEEYSEAMVGSDEQPTAVDRSLPKEEVIAYLRKLESAAARTGEVFSRVAAELSALIEEVEKRSTIDFEEIDKNLDRLGELVAESLRSNLNADELKELKQRVRSELKIYKKRVSKEMYAKLEKNYMARLLRQSAGLPEFSLFHVD